MFWNKEPLQYEILIPPLKKAFCKLTPNEAEEYFRWHMAHISERIEYLSQHASICIDYSSCSLKKLWKWFLKIACIEETPCASLQAKYMEVSSLDKNLAVEVVKGCKYQLSLQTEYIIRDVAMYVGEMFCHNFQGIHWTYHTNTQKDSFANMPILQGFIDRSFCPPFCPDFEPNHMVGVQAARLLRGKASSMDLLTIYNKWAEWAE